MMSELIVGLLIFGLLVFVVGMCGLVLWLMDHLSDD